MLVSIDYSFATIKILPVDANLKEKELQEHVLWEFQQHLISPIEEYNFDYQKLPKTSISKYPSLLIAAVKKPIIDAVRLIAEISDMNLKLIDINIFSSVNTLEKNYKLKSNSKIAFIEITNDHLIFIILEGKTLLGFHPIPLKEKPDDEISIEKISEEIMKNLRFFISDYESGKEQDKFDNVFLYKNNKELDLKLILASEEESDFEIINPLKNISISSDFKENMSSDLDYSEYTEAVGLAIRK